MSYIKGITIEIDGETKGLDAALRKINTTTRSLQGELTRVSSLLKLNPGNTDLVRQKQELLTQSIKETETKLKALKDAQKKLKAEGLDETNSDYRRLQREIQETDTKLKALTLEQKKFVIEGSKLGQVTAKMAQIGDKASEIGQKLRGISTAATVGLGAAAKVTSDFDSAMSKVMAVSGATGKEFDQLRDKAREMGAKTKFSAEESAEAMNYMAMAGWKTEEMLSGIEGIMNLAAASGEDLATTSDIVTDALTAMGYAAEDSGRLADVMAAASSNANTNVGLMGETFKYAAAVAGSLHYSMEDVALATGLMANAGIKGTQAGTSLRSVMSRMAAPTNEVSTAMDKLGISITNADGTTKPFRDVLVELREKMAGLSDTEKTQIANSIAGKNAMSGFLALINASEGDFNKLADAIDNSNGAAENMANTMLDNLGGQLTILKSALQELGIAMGDTLVPMVKKVVLVVQSIVDWFNNLSDSQKALVTKILLFTAALAPMLIVFGKVTNGINNSVLAFAKLYANIATGQGLIGTIVKTLIPMLKTALTSLFSILAANPIILVIAGIAALIAAFIKLWNESEAFRQFWINLWEGIKTTVITIVDGIKEVFSNTVEGIKNIWSSITAFFTALWNGIKDIFNGVITAWLTPFKLTWTLIQDVYKVAKTWFTTTGKNMISGLISGVKAMLNSCINAAKSIGDGIKNTLSSFSLISIGKNLIAGLAQGIRNGLSSAISAASSVAQNVLSAFKSKLKIHSPSRLMEDEIGRFIPLGIAKGMLKGIPDIKSAVEKTSSVASRLNMRAIPHAYSSNHVSGITTLDLRAAIREGISELSEPLQRGMSDAVDGMGLSIDGRQFGRIVRRTI